MWFQVCVAISDFTFQRKWCVESSEGSFQTGILTAQTFRLLLVRCVASHVHSLLNHLDVLWIT